jgi:hypothetical protein
MPPPERSFCRSRNEDASCSKALLNRETLFDAEEGDALRLRCLLLVYTSTMAEQLQRVRAWYEGKWAALVHPVGV